LAFEFSHKAERDLEEIGLYLKAHFPNKLKPTYARIVAACRQLVDYPKMGRVGRVRESREYVMPDLPYVIIYQEHDSSLIILRIYHAARRPLEH
jgi:plasmid stabilization system protein ParE